MSVEASAVVTSGRPDRLRSSRDVRHALRHGRRRATARFAVHVVENPGQQRPRLTTIASRRVGNAPARNRAKRLLRESAARVAWPRDADVVLVARPGIAGADLWDVLDDLAGMTEDWA